MVFEISVVISLVVILGLLHGIRRRQDKDYRYLDGRTEMLGKTVNHLVMFGNPATSTVIDNLATPNLDQPLLANMSPPVSGMGMRERYQNYFLKCGNMSHTVRVSDDVDESVSYAG